MTVICGPAPCIRCRSLVYWAIMPRIKSGTRAAWRNPNGLLHRCFERYEMSDAIERLSAAEAAMTPGPWEKSTVRGDEYTVWHHGSGGAVAWINAENETGPHHPWEDAEGIALLRNYAPVLIDAVKLLPRLRSTIKGIRGWATEHGDPELDAECARQINRIDAIEAALESKVAG